MNVFTKDPDAVIDFTHDWATDYLDQDETIVTSSWLAEPSDLIVVGGVHSAGTSTVTVSGGVYENFYRLANEVTTSDGRTDVRSIGVRVQHR